MDRSEVSFRIQINLQERAREPNHFERERRLKSGLASMDSGAAREEVTCRVGSPIKLWCVNTKSMSSVNGPRGNKLKHVSRQSHVFSHKAQTRFASKLLRFSPFERQEGLCPAVITKERPRWPR